MHQARSRRKFTSTLAAVGTVALTAAIFAVDAVTPQDLSVAVGYVAVVLVASRFCRPRAIALIGAGCVGLTVTSLLLQFENFNNTLASVAAIAVATILAARSKSAEIRLSEQAGLLDLTHDSIFVRGMDDVITYWNRGAEELYGWASEEAVGKVSHQLTQTIFPAPLEEINAELLRTGRWEGELIHTKRDATRVCVSSRWSLERDKQGRPAMILETNTDVTERKRGEDRLRESERRYRNIFEAAGVSIWEEDFSRIKALTDELKSNGVRDFGAHLATHPEFIQQAISKLKIIDVNDATVRLFGARSKDELLGSPDRIFTPERQDVFGKALVAIAEGLPSFVSETRLQTLEGEKIFVLYTITFPHHPDNLDTVLVTITDITKRKRAEILAATVIASVPDAMALIGRDYRYRQVNTTFARNWAMPAERIVGMHASELLGRELFEQIKPNLDRCFGGAEDTFSQWIPYPSGRRYVAVTYSPVRPDSERVEAALAIARDLTEHMLASEALQTAQAELAHVNRVTTMGQITASIAHEVNQPISAVILNANAALHWLDARPPELEEAQKALHSIVQDGFLASEVISRIHALIKKLPPRRHRVNVNEAICEVIALTRPEWEGNGVRVQTRLSNDLPLVTADRVQLQQVILNLIVNAIEAMSRVNERPRELTIVSDKSEANEVLVEVHDSGKGLETGDLDRVFDPFYTTKTDGMGMGLAISRSILQAHGGRLWAAPDMPHGAVFRLTLPVAAESSEDREPSLV